MSLTGKFESTASDTRECIQYLFEEQVARTPNARAVVAHDGQFSYAELDRRSNQLAHYLQLLGVGPEMRVGIALPRSAEMIVALLAVLKTGGAYVPIDPAYPLQRFRYLVQDSQVSVLLTHRGVPEGLNAEMTKVVPLESHWSRTAKHPESSPQPAAEGPNLSYIIYTSGSTGKPKGVMVSHENLIHSTRARLSYYSLAPGRFLVLSSFSFDSSVAGIFWTLLSGGELWLPPEGTQQNVVRIAEFIRRGSITHLLAVPSLYRSLLIQAANNELHTLQMVIAAGESCPADLVNDHLRLLPQTALFNEYGPTEATVWCTVYQAGATNDGSVPIGKPIAGMQVHILDPQLRPVEPDGVGELYIGGPQLARGYLDRPDLTAEKFLPNPFSRVPGARMYRTGDLARYGPDGNIDFLGRADQQVKVRGHRIELGEIESALRQHPQVEEAAVAGKKDDQGQQKLVAYVVPKMGEIDAANLRRFLSQNLPGYMVPSVYVTLDSLPMNANGKLDRQALPEPKPAESQNAYVAPRNQTEQTLAHLWADLLGIKRVGIHDNFFDLGGDSILGLQMIARANQAGIRLNVTQIADQPTIADLAAHCASAEEMEIAPKS